MTPREQQTLAIIMSHVGHVNGKVAIAAHLSQIRMVAGNQQRAVAFGGDYLIGHVEFGPKGARCA